MILSFTAFWNPMTCLISLSFWHFNMLKKWTSLTHFFYSLKTFFKASLLLCRCNIKSEIKINENEVKRHHSAKEQTLRYLCIYTKDFWMYLEPIKKKSISRSSRLQNHAQTVWLNLYEAETAQSYRNHYRVNSISPLPETSRETEI